MSEIYKRQIRITSTPSNSLEGFAVSVKDITTGELIDNVKSITVHINPIKLTTAELTYLECDTDGNYVVKDGEAVTHVATAENPELDIVALERCATSIGGYDISWQTSRGNYVGFLNIEDEARNGVQFAPDEVLELLKWLQQERPNFEMQASLMHKK